MTWSFSTVSLRLNPVIQFTIHKYRCCLSLLSDYSFAIVQYTLHGQKFADTQASRLYVALPQSVDTELEWSQIPKATLQTVVEILSRRVEDIIKQREA